MSYMICKNIKKNDDGSYTLKVADNNVYPRDYYNAVIKHDEAELALDKIVALAYYRDLQFNAEGKRCKWGRTICKAIDMITNGAPVWEKYEGTREEEQEELKLCQRMVYTGVAQEK